MQTVTIKVASQGEALKLRRLALGLRQADVAKLAGRSRPMVTFAELGSGTRETIRRVDAALRQLEGGGQAD